MLSLPSMAQTASAALALGFSGFLYFCYRLYQQRSLARGLPGPPHHPILGHLQAAYQIAGRLPSDCHPHMYGHYMQKEYNLGNFFYFDTWPFGPPILMILDPDIAAQVTQTHSLDKHPSMGQYLKPLLGVNNMVAVDGPMWKKLRSMFNPGFSLNHLMTQVPDIVDNTLTFVETLNNYAKNGRVFQCEEEATRLTVDIIGKVVLDTDLNAQRSENELVNALRSQAASLPGNTRMEPWKDYNPVSPVIQWRNTRIMDNYIGRELSKRFETKETISHPKKKKHIIDLALETYLTEISPNAPGTSPTSKTITLDPTFVAHATNQIKTFIFAGHDTTSSTICYIYHFLSRSPSALAALRTEHDSVFGPDPSSAADALKSDPNLLSNSHLPYTLAVIRETLRIYPAASSVRKGNPDVPIIDPETGKAYPTAGFMVWPLPHAIHRRADLFPKPLEFHPERFLPDPPPPFPNPVPKDAWRPFEKGPRNCIGQELAILETKIIMALTCRLFDFEAAYEGPGYDGSSAFGHSGTAGNGNGNGHGEEGAGKGDKKWNMIDGERAYQILLGTAKPKAGFPCRVWRAGEKPQRNGEAARNGHAG